MNRTILLFVLSALLLSCSEGGKVETNVDASSDSPGADGASLDGVGDSSIPDKDSSEPPKDGIGDSSSQDGMDDARFPGDAAEDSGTPGVTVGTYTESDAVGAGVPLQVTCVVKGKPEGSYVTYLFVAGPANVTVDDLKVTFSQTGVYKVGCAAAWNGGEAKDPTPVSIRVDAGKTASIQTSLSDNDIVAGETVLVTCTIKDEFGNTVVTTPKVVVNPSFGLDVMGMSIIGVKAGDYQVTCFDPVAQMSDLTPEKLKVRWGLPRRISTELSTDTIVAGGISTVTCKAMDAYDNPVPDFPVAVFLSHGLDIDGFKITGTKAGMYQVICVPQLEDWDLFALTPKALRIIAGSPTHVALQAQPPKPAYRMFETITFKASALDAYGNLVEDAAFLPMSVQPFDPGVIQVSQWKYKYEVEGEFLMSACLQSNSSICGTLKIVVDGFGPIITIKFPERGATLNGKPAVTVIGNVVDPVGGVNSFMVNGQYVQLQPNGDFSYVISSAQGMNMLVALAEDSHGFKTLHVQSYYYSPVWFKATPADIPGSRTKDGILFFLSNNLLDDHDHDTSYPNDLSTIAEMTLATLDIGAFMPNPVASAGPYKVYVGPFSYDPPDVSLGTADDKLRLAGDIDDISIGIQAKGECKVLFIDFCPDVSGRVTVDNLNLLLAFFLYAQDGKPKLDLVTNSVVISGVNVDIDGIIGFLLGWLVNWIVDGYTDVLEQTVMDAIADQVGGLVDGVLGSLALDQQLSIPNPLDPTAPAATLSLDAYISKITVDPFGILLQLDPAVVAEKAVPHTILGSIGRAYCLAFQPEVFQPNVLALGQIALLDDFVNQLLYSAWNSGLLNMTVPADQFITEDALEGLGIGSLQDLGISDIVARTDFYLPPIVTSCNDFQDLQMQIGDAYIELNMKMLNQPVTIGMFVSLAAVADILVTNGPTGPEVSLGLGEIDPMVAQITYISDNLAGAEGIMSMLIQGLILPSLLDSFLSDSLASFAVPTINLSSLSNMLPPNIVWKFFVDHFYRYLGYTTLEAHIEVM